MYLYYTINDGVCKRCAKLICRPAVKALDFTGAVRYNKLRCVKGIALHEPAGGGGAVSKDLAVSYLLDFYGDVLTDKQRDVME